MKIAIIAVLATLSSAVSTEGHTNLRHRELCCGPETTFDQDAVVAAANDPNRVGGGCAVGEFDATKTTTAWGKTKDAIDVPLAGQCLSACDCEFRCCSGGNNFWFITPQSAALGVAAGTGGGVCVTIPNTVTAAAERAVS